MTSAAEIEQTQLAAITNILDNAAGGASNSSTTATPNASPNSNSPTGANPSNGGTGARVSLATLRTQIESAVNGALGGLNSSTATNAGAAAKAVRDAINKTLQQDGLLANDNPSGSTDSSSSTGGASIAAAASSSSSVSSSANPATTPVESSANGTSSDSTVLAALLARNNIDPTVFQNSILSALTNASAAGGADFSQLFANFPVGQDIDTFA